MKDIVPLIKHVPARLAVLISGGGTTLQNLAEKCKSGHLPAQIAVAIASNTMAVEKAKEKNPDINVKLINRKDFNTPSEFSDVVFGVIRDSDIDLVCLAGFLCLLDIPDDFVGRILNIHPALLPAFGGKGMYGHHVHEAVLAHGCKVSGCTVHFADQTYDTGPIILQRSCPVHEDDTPEILAERVFTEECKAYPEAIKLICEGRVRITRHSCKIRV